MKFFSTVAFTALLATTAFGQGVHIGYPPDGTTVAAGSNLVVEIDRPNSLSNSQEVAVVLGLQFCPNTPCRPPTDILGTILYNGPYKPEYQSDAPGWKPPHQNFTVTIPQETPKGKAQLGLAHFTLIGAGLLPYLQTLNISLNVV